MNLENTVRYKDGKKICRTAGAKMLTISEKAEEAFLRDTIKKFFGESAKVGLQEITSRNFNSMKSSAYVMQRLQEEKELKSTFITNFLIKVAYDGSNFSLIKGSEKVNIICVRRTVEQIKDMQNDSLVSYQEAQQICTQFGGEHKLFANTFQQLLRLLRFLLYKNDIASVGIQIQKRSLFSETEVYGNRQLYELIKRSLKERSLESDVEYCVVAERNNEREYFKLTECSMNLSMIHCSFDNRVESVSQEERELLDRTPSTKIELTKNDCGPKGVAKYVTSVVKQDDENSYCLVAILTDENKTKTVEDAEDYCTDKLDGSFFQLRDRKELSLIADVIFAKQWNTSSIIMAAVNNPFNDKANLGNALAKTNGYFLSYSDNCLSLVRDYQLSKDSIWFVDCGKLPSMFLCSIPMADTELVNQSLVSTVIPTEPFSVVRVRYVNTLFLS
uniref:C-type lectin domain-containing protein n=1 Tax=Syphacia muris TaxID=451379 RepID=A0A0N5AI97_9BILA